MSRSHDPYAAFRVRDYRMYVLGWLLAMIGTRMQSVAIGWEMYQRTGEALSPGAGGPGPGPADDDPGPPCWPLGRPL